MASARSTGPFPVEEVVGRLLGPREGRLLAAEARPGAHPDAVVVGIEREDRLRSRDLERRSLRDAEPPGVEEAAHEAIELEQRDRHRRDSGRELLAGTGTDAEGAHRVD